MGVISAFEWSITINRDFDNRSTSYRGNIQHGAYSDSVAISIILNCPNATNLRLKSARGIRTVCMMGCNSLGAGGTLWLQLVLASHWATQIRISTKAHWARKAPVCHHKLNRKVC